jgi:nickel and cobalt resistance protein CnrR
MNHRYGHVKWTLLVVVLSFSLCALIGYLFFSHHLHTHDPHQWLHQELSLSKEQDNKLHPIEEKFIRTQKDIEKTIQAAQQALAIAINQDGYYSERVQKASADIHTAQGKLQEATLMHLFEMHQVLDERQRKKLNALTTHALTHTP